MEYKTEFATLIRQTLAATYNDLAGLIDSPDDIEEYKENRMVSLIDQAVKDTGESWEVFENIVADIRLGL